MRCEVIPYGEDLWPSLRPAWESLSASDASPFLSPAWMRAWLAAFGALSRPRGLLWRAPDGRPVGCALLSVGPAKLGPFPVERAYLNASGAGVSCEVNDVLTLPESRASVLDDLVRVVVAENVDEFALVGVREDLLPELRARWPLQLYEGHMSEAPFVNLERVRATGEPYLTCVSANTRSQVRRAIRLYRELFGAPDVRVAGSPVEAQEWFDALVELHSRTWWARGEPGAFADPAVRRFHLDLLLGPDEGGEQGRLAPEIQRIRFGDEVIAYLYHLRYRGRVNFYQSGLAYDTDNRLKPGLVAHALAVEHYLSLGESAYDFLGGEPEAVRYKRSLATDSRMLAWVELPSPTAKMRVLRGLRLARRRLRAMLARNASTSR